MSYGFKLGEEKEVGIEVSSSDGSNFSISATYEYLDNEGKVLDNGSAKIDGKKVFVLLKPSIPGYRQEVKFKCILTPLNDNGQPDPEKNIEKIIPSVNVFVNP